MIFKSKEELEVFISMNALFAIAPKRKAKTKFVYPWSSNHARKVVLKGLSSKLWNALTETDTKLHAIDGDI